ncbi:PocR ligand-binding domain-containing protein [Irregularibacter muris]|uniref:histidine kinase n=1 Tax=Irregularibacter muris TaxID=1796619 RepID=A0AAE3HFB0_9FIRM|nr:PocR ligand-binding domain-containing protein [Irregularibacter muris]MCR1898404.1 PocR ligand-binding domain-containing protein [Irregularibacter muris]
MRVLSLKDIIDVQDLQDIQDSFSQVTKLAAVTVDFRGEPITKYSNFTNYCMKFREKGICRDICYQSDAFGGLQSARTGKPHIYRCHSGLYDMAVPIIFEGQFLGSILAGQVKLQGTENKYSTSVPGVSEEMKDHLNTPELKELLKDIAKITEEELESAAQLLFIFGNYVVKSGIAQYAQQQLNEKNNKLIAEMKARIELEKNLKDAEIKILKSQINPHFLFNTLNTISNLSMMEGAEKTTEVIFFLADMLRYTIKNEVNYMVSVEQELSYVLKYLKIQQIRMGHKLKFSINVDEKFYNLKMPFMILQPIVCNSIDHGIFSRDRGYIHITAQELEEDILLTVEDNGVGIEQSKIDQILQGKYVDNQDELSNGIGLINADKRLIHQFGPDYRLKINSIPGKGTKVTIKIPR